MDIFRWLWVWLLRKVMVNGELLGFKGVNTGVKVRHISMLPLRRSHCFVYDFRAWQVLVIIKK